MKVLTEEERREILSKIRRAPKKKRGRRGPQRPRPLSAAELEGSRHLRRVLENQSVRAATRSSRFPPGSRLSLELVGCGHRTRVLALESGLLPARARFPR